MHHRQRYSQWEYCHESMRCPCYPRELQSCFRFDLSTYINFDTGIYQSTGTTDLAQWKSNCIQNTNFMLIKIQNYGAFVSEDIYIAICNQIFSLFAQNGNLLDYSYILDVIFSAPSKLMPIKLPLQIQWKQEGCRSMSRPRMKLCLVTPKVSTKAGSCVGAREEV